MRVVEAELLAMHVQVVVGAPRGVSRVAGRKQLKRLFADEGGESNDMLAPAVALEHDSPAAVVAMVPPQAQTVESAVVCPLPPLARAVQSHVPFALVASVVVVCHTRGVAQRAILPRTARNSRSESKGGEGPCGPIQRRGEHIVITHACES